MKKDMCLSIYSIAKEKRILSLILTTTRDSHRDEFLPDPAPHIDATPHARFFAEGYQSIIEKFASGGYEIEYVFFGFGLKESFGCGC
jgi:hypothetical protein